MRLAKFGLLALLLATPASFGAEPACSCTNSCQAACEQGQNENCECDCGCKETGQCSHDKCNTENSESDQ